MRNFCALVLVLMLASSAFGQGSPTAVAAAPGSTAPVVVTAPDGGELTPDGKFLRLSQDWSIDSLVEDDAGFSLVKKAKFGGPVTVTGAITVDGRDYFAWAFPAGETHAAVRVPAGTKISFPAGSKIPKDSLVPAKYAPKPVVLVGGSPLPTGPGVGLSPTQQVNIGVGHEALARRVDDILRGARPGETLRGAYDAAAAAHSRANEAYNHAQGAHDRLTPLEERVTKLEKAATMPPSTPPATAPAPSVTSTTAVAVLAAPQAVTVPTERTITKTIFVESCRCYRTVTVRQLLINGTWHDVP